MEVRPGLETDWPWITTFCHERWGGTTMAQRGEAVDLLALPALIAEPGLGLAIWRVDGGLADLLLLDAFNPRRGIGSALLAALEDLLRAYRVRRLRASTTNDNLDALRFYQRRGFQLDALRPGAVDAARRFKPRIPALGQHDIPIRDEIDLVKILP